MPLKASVWGKIKQTWALSEMDLKQKAEIYQIAE